MKIYTKTGDDGTTSLIGGTKVLKSDLRIEAYGTVDELNAHLGLCKDLILDEGIKRALKEVQDCLFIVGSCLACDPDKNSKMALPYLLESDVEALEQQIDQMDKQLPPLKNFVLPGGNPSISELHIARCVCRRAERCAVRIGINSQEVDPLIIKYLNRLSDYLFVLGRYTAFQLKIGEIPWKPRG